MSGGYDRYDLHRRVDLSKVERIIYIDDATKANLARSNLLSGTIPNIGSKIAGAPAILLPIFGIVPESRLDLARFAFVASSMYIILSTLLRSTRLCKSYLS